MDHGAAVSDHLISVITGDYYLTHASFSVVNAAIVYVRSQAVSSIQIQSSSRSILLIRCSSSTICFPLEPSQPSGPCEILFANANVGVVEGIFEEN